MIEVADEHDQGNLKLKRALEVEEVNAAVLSTLHPRSPYNPLLLLQKEGFDEKLQTMSDEIIKTFQGYCLPKRITLTILMNR